MDNKPTNYQTIICDTCGSNDIELITDEIAACNRCGSKILIRKEHNEVTNNFFNNNESSGEVENSRCAVITSEVRNPETFKRDALLSLAVEKNTPPDIFQSQFYPVTTQLTQYARVYYQYTLHISASVGYKRQEEYTDYEIQYVYGKQHKVPVFKTRTVIDWKPYSNTLVGEDFGFKNLIENIDDGDRVLSFIRKEKGKYEAKFIEDTDFQVQRQDVTQSQINEIINDNYPYLEKEARQSLPGDDYKDFNFTVNYEIKEVRYIMFPQYFLPYNYNDKNYDVRAFKASTENYLANCPNYSEDTDKMFEKKTKGTGFLSIFMSCLSLILAIIFAFIKKSSASLPAIVICLCVSGLFYLIHKMHYQSVKDEIMGGIQNQKLKDLKNCLSQNNLQPLTEQEIKRISWRKS